MSRPLLALALAAALLSCSRTIPETHHYSLLTPPAARSADVGHGVVTVDELSADSAYDDERIVYRTSAVRLDYYHYHRWSSRPAEQVADYLHLAWAGSGRFCLVARDSVPETSLIVGGHVIAFDEVDVTPTRWVGRVELDLFAKDARTGKVVWRKRVREQEPLDRRDAEGLARALSRALARIAAETLPAIADASREATRGDESTCGASHAAR